ncbi:hypothetical protein [Cysteiniphilum litorale]|uniref:hypothetical protein n=1 Tax=Cysteiniphilum litorale TaxID=2056700 RepID=UPI003F881C22
MQNIAYDSHARYSVYAAPDPNSCSYEVIKSTDTSRSYSFHCQVVIYNNTNGQPVSLAYEINGGWKSAYSTGEKGWQWRIIDITPPTSTMKVLDSNLQPFVHDAGLHYKTYINNEQHYQIKFNGGVSFSSPEEPTKKLNNVGVVDLYTGYPTFTGNMRWLSTLFMK